MSASEPRVVDAPADSSTRDELVELRRTLQDSGLALLEAATTVVTAAAKDTLGAAVAVMVTAQRTLGNAEEELRKLRAHLEERGVPLPRPESGAVERDEERVGTSSPG